jgi:hypothetical protein
MLPPERDGISPAQRFHHRANGSGPDSRGEHVQPLVSAAPTDRTPDRPAGSPGFQKWRRERLLRHLQHFDALRRHALPQEVVADQLGWLAGADQRQPARRNGFHQCGGDPTPIPLCLGLVIAIELHGAFRDHGDQHDPDQESGPQCSVDAAGRQEEERNRRPEQVPGIEERSHHADRKQRHRCDNHQAKQ